jgi:hypothetical protein
MCAHGPRRIRAESQVDRKSHSPYGSRDIRCGLSMKITEVRTYSAKEKKQRDGSDQQHAYPPKPERRMMVQRVILAEYEKVVGEEEPVPTVRSDSERVKAFGQLKNDSLINEEEYNPIRNGILEELLVVSSYPVPKRVCPNCSSEYVARVSRAGLERLMSLFHIYPFRCQLCWHRFRLFQWGVTYRRIDLDSRAAHQRQLTGVR